MFLPQHCIATKCICFICADPERGMVPDPLSDKSQKIVFLSNTGPNSPPPPKKKEKKTYKKHKASVQCLSIDRPSMKRRLVGVSLA